jgi:hypothetical protein
MKTVIKNAINKLSNYTNNNQYWKGRENEIVNLFAHDMLFSEINEKGPLYHIGQIGIEVSVQQIDSNKKKLVRKDLIIWPIKNMTVWQNDDEYNVPLVIIEFKINKIIDCQYDKEWLMKYTRNKTTIGYSIFADIKNKYIKYWEIENGKENTV